MRHSVVVKFIAVFLCAASLLGAAGSAVGIFAMSEMGLRNRTLEEAYAASTESTVNALANELAERYAGRELGGAEEELLDQYYGNHWIQSTFNWDQVGYAILDQDGNVLEDRQMPVAQETLAPYDLQISGGQYLNVLNTMTQDEYEALYNPPAQTLPPTEPVYVGVTAYNTVPAEGCKISYIHVYYADGRFGDYEAPDNGYLGQLSYYTSNQLRFQVQSDCADAERLFDDFYTGLPVSMSFMNTEGEIVLDISTPDCVLEEFSENHGNAYFLLRPLEETTVVPESSIYDAIAPEGEYVSTVSVTYADGWCESTGGTPDIGFLGYDEDGFVVFTANSLGIMEYRTEPVTYISFSDEEGNPVYEASDPDGVGRFSQEEDTLVFRSGSATGMDTPPAASDDGIYVYDDVPPGGYAVHRMELWLEGASRGLVIEETKGHLGHADHDSSGNVIFTALNWQDFVFSKPANVVYILMTSEDGRLLYEARQEGVPTGSGCSIGTFSYDADGDLVFCRDGAAPAASAEEVSASETAPAVTEETIPENTEAEQVDPELQSEETAEFTAPTMAQEEIPAITEEETDVVAAETETAVGTEPTMAEEVTEPADLTEPTAPETVPEVTEENLDLSIPDTTEPYAAAEAEADIRVFGYYDPSAGEHMVVQYTYEEMPEYRVQVRMGAGALAYQYEWILMEQIYALKDYLIPGLIICLFTFAVTAVYLCCSAGRRPGTGEVRANGLNCIPLDLYLAAVVGGVAVCAVAFVEGGDYLLRQDMNTGILFCLLVAFAACLLVVAFCFAFAAQVKTPGGYWWRNSLCGRSGKLIAWLWNRFVDLCAWLWDVYDRKLQPALVRLFKALWKLTKFFCIQLKAAVLWLADKVIRVCRWSCENLIRGWRWMTQMLARFFSMLPLTWQFLVTGFLLVFLLYVMMRTYKVGYILLGFGVFFGVILYAASAFGILLENAKRMRKGDLDTKVDDKLLIGGFRDFAEELNGLADVAVVAAQKQLKSERMKTELITNVSHDIKTPLTSIINYVDLMEKPHSPEEQQAYLEVLSRQSQRLKKLIDDLMEMSKASTGNMAVDITRVNAAEAVNQALGEFADKLEKAQLTPVFRQPETDICMMADGRLVWRVLSNLLSNAVKYALPGTRVYIDLMELEGKVVLSLKNISRDSLNINADELLERFVRGDAARNTEGSGLGLNIAQSLMELQKGKLELLVDGDLFKVTLIFPGA